MPLKAFLAIFLDVSFLDIIFIVLIFLHPLNAFLPILTIFLLMVTVLSFVLFLNALSAILVTLYVIVLPSVFTFIEAGTFILAVFLVFCLYSTVFLLLFVTTYFTPFALIVLTFSLSLPEVLPVLVCPGVPDGLVSGAFVFPGVPGASVDVTGALVASAGTVVGAADTTGEGVAGAAEGSVVASGALVSAGAAEAVVPGLYAIIGRGTGWFIR